MMEKDPKASRKNDPQEQCQVDQNSYLSNKAILLNCAAVGFYSASENGRNEASARRRIESTGRRFFLGLTWIL